MADLGMLRVDFFTDGTGDMTEVEFLYQLISPAYMLLKESKY